MSDPDLVYVQVNLNEALDEVKIPKTFKCGDDTLDKHVRSGDLKRAIRSENLSATAICNEQNELIGFMTIGYSLLEKSRVPSSKGNQPKQLPVAKIYMLAVVESHQGRGLGTDLMLEAFIKAVAVHSTIPLKGIYLDAAPGKASLYSDKFGFTALEDEGPNGTTPMFIPIEDVIAALVEADYS